jgi:hypothetical protein
MVYGEQTQKENKPQMEASFVLSLLIEILLLAQVKVVFRQNLEDMS